jgi:hypothetical protein
MHQSSSNQHFQQRQRNHSKLFIGFPASSVCSSYSVGCMVLISQNEWHTAILLRTRKNSAQISTTTERFDSSHACQRQCGQFRNLVQRYWYDCDGLLHHVSTQEYVRLTVAGDKNAHTPNTTATIGLSPLGAIAIAFFSLQLKRTVIDPRQKVLLL